MCARAAFCTFATQAVALIFDHAMLPLDSVGVPLGMPAVVRSGRLNTPPSGHTAAADGSGRVGAPLASSGSIQYREFEGLAGREVAALKLLRDLITWAQAVDTKHPGEHAAAQCSCFSVF